MVKNWMILKDAVEEVYILVHIVNKNKIFISDRISGITRKLQCSTKTLCSIA